VASVANNLHLDAGEFHAHSRALPLLLGHVMP
jgi:hypothetical protein